MRAVVQDSPGGAETLYIGEVDTPKPKKNELLIKVRATALNRADTLQREGKYPAPPGASNIIGLEVAGVIDAIGEGCDSKWKVGDHVISLLSGGGYAEYVSVHESIVIPLPSSISFIDGAAIAESWMTAFQVLYFVAHMKDPKYVLIHAGASSLGVAAIQLVKQAGGNVITTCGSNDKVEFCKSVGADHVINYKETPNFDEEVDKITSSKGVDIVIDCVGASYFQKNLNSLGMDGTLVLVGFLSGSQLSANDNLALILRKRLIIVGSTLRSRSDEYKSDLAKQMSEHCLPRFVDGRMKVIVDKVFPFEQIGEAHKYMEANSNKGKIVIEVSNN